MSTTVNMDTQRTKVLDAILALFPIRGTPAAAAFETEYGLGWSLVSRDPLGQLPKGKISSLGIYAPTTARAADFPAWRVGMDCVAEVTAAKETGTSITKTLERMLGVVERCLRANKGLGGLVYDIEVTSDSVDLDGPYEAQAEAALYFTVKFFQHLEDPRQGRA